MAAININQYKIGVPAFLSANGSNPAPNTLHIEGNIVDGNDIRIPLARLRIAIQLVACGPMVNLTESAGGFPTRESEAEWVELEGNADSSGVFDLTLLLTAPGTARLAIDTLGGTGYSLASSRQDVAIA